MAKKPKEREIDDQELGVATTVLHGIINAAGYDQITKRTYFISVDVATKKAVQYARALIAELKKV